MGLADRLSEPRLVRKGTPCSVSVILGSLSPKDADALRKALDDPAFLTAHIHAELTTEGFAIAKPTIQRHRKGECVCDRSS